MRARAVVFAVLLVAGAVPAPPTGASAAGRPAHGLSMYGELKYPAGFPHFAYVDPRAPKGGAVTLSAIGTFDSLNPFILKGVPATGLGQTFDTLMVGSADEALTEYGLVAETVETPADRSWVAFTLRRQARFHDGSPITVEDVIWTFQTLRAHGHPFYRSYYAQVASAEPAGLRRVRFTFKGGVNRELPLIGGQMPVLPKAWWAGRDFAKTTLQPLLGSGPYRVESVDPGRSSSRPSRAAPTIFGRRTRPSTGRPATRSRPCAMGGSARSRFPTRSRPACRASSTTRGARSSAIPACGRRSPTHSTSSGRTRTCSTALTPGPRATSPTPSWPRAACRARLSGRRWPRSARASPRRSSPRSTGHHRPSPAGCVRTWCGPFGSWRTPAG